MIKKIYLTFLLIIGLVRFAEAQNDVITFTWNAEANAGATATQFYFESTGGPYTVHWGDGSTDSWSGFGGWRGKDYSIAGTYTVTIVADDPACRFTALSIATRNLTSLDVSGSTALYDITAHNNQLTRLIIDPDNHTPLTTLQCQNNKLPLKDLYVAASLASGATTNRPGTQRPDTLPAISRLKHLITEDTLLGGTATTYSAFRLDGVTAVANVDYIRDGHFITFLKEGLYTLEARNSAIPASDALYDAVVIFAYEVSHSDQITFTWTGDGSTPKSFSLYATAGETFTVDWGNGTTTTHTGNGNAEATPPIEHVYGDDASYDVTVRASSPECRFILLDVNGRNLTALDVSNSPELTTLQCHNNQITTLDLTENTKLAYLLCYSNQLPALDVSENTKLTTLTCNNNRLTTLDVSQNTLLTQLSCVHNQLTTLDVSKNTALTHLACHSNRMTSLDIRDNPVLNSLYCYDNKLPLKDLYAAWDHIRSTITLRLGAQILDTITTSTNTRQLITADTLFETTPTQYTNIMLDGVAAVAGTDYILDGHFITFLKEGIFTIDATNGAIQSNLAAPAKAVLTFKTESPLDQITFTWTGSRTGGSNRRSFVLYATEDEEFTVDWGDGSTITTHTGNGYDKDTILEYLYGDTATYDVIVTASSPDCRFTGLTAMYRNITVLDVSQSPMLTELIIHSNYTLDTLDVSNNKELTHLDCGWTSLTTLDVSENTKLTYLNCSTANSLTALDVSNNPLLTYLNCGYVQKLTTLDISNNLALTYLNCSFNELTTLDVTPHTALTELICHDNLFTDLDVTQNPALTVLNCSFNEIAELDLSNNTQLLHLNCRRNELLELDLEHNTALTFLDCGNNNLTELDLTSNTALDTVYCQYSSDLAKLLLPNTATLTLLDCRDSKVTALDVSNNPGLQRLVCYNNQLATLDLSNNTVLTELYCSNNQLTELKLSSFPLTDLSCYDNKLPLRDLYVASKRVDDVSDKLLGPQFFDLQNVEKGEPYLITIDTVFDGQVTQYDELTFNGSPAVEGVDYELDGHYITFLNDGIYTLEASNEAITSYQHFPATVVFTYSVTLVDPPCEPTDFLIAMASCDSIVYDGVVFIKDTTFTDTLVNAAGCDSLVTVNLTVHHKTFCTIDLDSCDQITYNGIVFIKDTTFTVTLVNAAGCDSVITVNLTVHSVESQFDTVYRADCDSVYHRGKFYHSSTIVDTLIEMGLCSFLETAFLTVHHSYFDQQYVSGVDSVVYLSNVYYQNTTLVYPYQTIAGCDSVIEVFIVVTPSPDPPGGDAEIVVYWQRVLAVANPQNLDELRNATYYWYRNGVLLPQSNSDWIEIGSPIPAGTYHVDIYSYGNKILSLERILNAPSGISAYPNPLPVEGELTVESVGKTIQQVDIFDGNGRLVQGFNSPGIYILQIHFTDQTVETLKIIVQ
ncbi:MAG: hypothetical protein FWG79_05480 [Bacteroidales bacterium]|nr:hypothetical protein [Bacteroidales bacterium]